jgi:ribosome assembly protein 4
MTEAPQKRQKTEEPQQLLVQFRSAEGDLVGPELDISDAADTEQLSSVLNALLSNEDPYTFYLDSIEVKSSLRDACGQASHSYELVVPLTYHPMSLFRVHAVTRSSSSLTGHTESILAVQFSPDGRNLATGGGDAVVRTWDIDTETPHHTLEGHKNWVLVVCWSPDGLKLASAGADGTIRIWSPSTGQALGKPLRGHAKWVTSLSWRPLHLEPDSRSLVSSSKDGTIKTWDSKTFTAQLSLTSHSAAVTRVIWGGEDILFSCSQDRLVKVWEASSGRLIRNLSGHGHWVNQLSVSTDYRLRTGDFDPLTPTSQAPNERQAVALEKYRLVAGKGERLVSCSDDFTMFLWSPHKTEKPLTRMTGHQQLVSQVSFSPDGHFIVSASFDKSLRLWDGFSGAFITTFRGHVGAVFQVSWSPDSRMLVSGSKDSTLKVWSMRTKKLAVDLPGHADQVYAVDWSPDGLKVASGGRDRVLNIWRN